MYPHDCLRKDGKRKRFYASRSSAKQCVRKGQHAYQCSVGHWHIGHKHKHAAKK